MRFMIALMALMAAQPVAAQVSASAANGIPLPAGGAFNCGGFQGIVLTDQVSITSATVGATFVVVSQ